MTNRNLLTSLASKYAAEDFDDEIDNWFVLIDERLIEEDFDFVDTILGMIADDEEPSVLHRSIVDIILVAAAPKQCRKSLPNFELALDKYYHDMKNRFGEPVAHALTKNMRTN